MKSIERAVERFCYNHPRFGIKNLMKYIIILNAAVFILTMMDTTGTLLSFLYFSPYLILKKGQIWRLISFVIVPAYYGAPGNILHEALTLYFYYFIGNTLENHWGQAKFSLYYISGILLSAVYGFILYFMGYSVELTVTVYYINMAMFFAFATMWPDASVLLFFIIPIRMKWLALVDAVLFVYDMVMMRSLFPLVAILNYFIFCGGTLISRFSAGRGMNKVRSNFKVDMAKIKCQEKTQLYRHKCSVCGRTDAEYPQLEFRYCSKCAGYHCFCEDHINNHIHFTE